LDWLTADLPPDGVVEEALERDAFEDGFAYHYSQDLGCHFEQLLHQFVVVEFVEGLGGLAEGQEAELGAEDLGDAEVHPLPEQPSSVSRLLLIGKHDFDLFVEVDGLELGMAGHEEVGPVHLQVLGFAGGPVYSQFLEV